MSRGLAGLVVAAGIVAAAGSAAAQSAPSKPGLTLPRGKLSISIALEANMSSGAAFKPFSIAPDISYGVNDALTVSLVHSGFALTGFRGSAGAGLCVAGEENGCASVYRNVGAEALYRLASGPLSLAANAGVHDLDVDQSFFSLKLGLKGRYSAGKVYTLFLPSVLVGLNDRDAGNADTLWVPVSVWYRAIPELAVGAGTGIKGPLDGFADGWTLPFGVLAQYSIAPTTTVGASWIFGRLAGAGALPDGSTGADFRALQVWVSHIH